MNKKNITNHFKYYFLLAIVQVTGLIVLLSLQGQKELQIGVVFTMTAAYLALAIAHQHLHHRLSMAVVLEYTLFGVFGIIISLLYFK